MAYIPCACAPGWEYIYFFSIFGAVIQSIRIYANMSAKVGTFELHWISRRDRESDLKKKWTCVYTVVPEGQCFQFQEFAVVHETRL